MNRILGLAVLILAAALLVIVWSVAPHSPPLYDGLVNCSGPYQYLNPPKGLGPQHRNPTSGKSVERLIHGKFTESALQTKAAAGNAPQAILQLGDGAVSVPPGIDAVTLLVRPVPSPGPISNGVLDGNVYLFRATGNNGRSLTLNAKIGGLLELRKTGQELSAHMEMYRGGTWVAQSTLSFVNACYLATDAKHFGYYALIAPSHESPFLTRYLPLLIVALVVLVLVITAFVAIRLSRRAPATEEAR